MLWMKKKYAVDIKRGCGQVKTDGLHGFIQQLIIEPSSENTIWSMKILDRDKDVIYKVKDHEGQLNERDGLPVGKDKPEELFFMFNDLTKNERIKLIINIRESQ